MKGTLINNAFKDSGLLTKVVTSLLIVCSGFTTKTDDQPYQTTSEGAKMEMWNTQKKGSCVTSSFKSMQSISSLPVINEILFYNQISDNN